VSISSCSSTALVPIDTAANKLIEHFCKCPAARDLLAQKMGNLVHPLFLSVEDFPYAKTDFGYLETDLTELESATIVIPEHFSKDESLAKLTYELFNCMRDKFTRLNAKAKVGDVSMDRYAIDMEKVQLGHAKASDTVLSKCAGVWKENMAAHYMHGDPNKPMDLEVEAWTQDFMAHSDVHRATWIDQFQKKYCKLHPEDQRSCKMKKKDLVDFSAFNRLSITEQGKIMAKRICERFSVAPKKVQNENRRIAQANCPKVVKDADKRKDDL